MTTQLLITTVEEAVAQMADAPLNQQFALRLKPRASGQVGIKQRGRSKRCRWRPRTMTWSNWNTTTVDASECLRRQLGQEALRLFDALAVVDTAGVLAGVRAVVAGEAQSKE